MHKTFPRSFAKKRLDTCSVCVDDHSRRRSNGRRVRNVGGIFRVHHHHHHHQKRRPKRKKDLTSETCVDTLETGYRQKALLEEDTNYTNGVSDLPKPYNTA
ncbi:uncharacterized protein LOC122502752 [Leptopilina heterotoma]|uniref:uncharacterized protein LOC122502752 n=1 Tax=Leptopilina heterotoma TaxID=63436 RepID=UPI001CA906DA|nr:uncharacterized protein LOC122502752 [Leptopilina heterotoma]